MDAVILFRQFDMEIEAYDDRRGVGEGQGSALVQTAPRPPALNPAPGHRIRPFLLGWSKLKSENGAAAVLLGKGDGRRR